MDGEVEDAKRGGPHRALKGRALRRDGARKETCDGLCRLVKEDGARTMGGVAKPSGASLCGVGGVVLTKLRGVHL